MPQKHSPLRIGIFGAGTVGGNVIRALQSQERVGQLSHRANRRLELLGITRRNPNADPSIRDLCLPKEELIAQSDIVIELMGGMQSALEVILTAIREKKTVVTANKAVIAHHFAHIMAAAKQSGTRVLCSAGVGGGMDVLPRIDVMARSERIKRIQAIINTTSNVILTLMERGMTYSDALKAAQDAGFAEADPSLDVNGDDAVQKLTILIARAFGLILCPSDILKEGIIGISGQQRKEARREGMVLKHVVEAERVPHRSGRAVRAHAKVTAVPAASLLGATNEALNTVMLRGERSWQAYFGQGAGGAATAETVLNDLVRAAQPAEEYGSPFEGHFRTGILMAD